MGLWKSCDFGTCIYKDFFQDGVHNCPYKSCKDESSCTVFSHNGKYLKTRLFVSDE